MFETESCSLNDEQRIAALRALAAKTRDRLLAMRFKRIADEIERRNRELLRH